jgi:serine/threonine protein kinase
MLADGRLPERHLNYIVMPKYDMDVERLFQRKGKKFKLDTVVTLGLQMVERLEIMHGCGLVHNDIKP